MKFRAAVIQMDSGADWEENMRCIERFAEEAAGRGADYIQFPETVEYIGTDPGRFAERHGEEAVRFFSRLARSLGCHINCGSLTEYRPGQRPRNTMFFFGPDGRLLEKYSKLHLFDVDVKEGPSYRESDEIQAGDAIVTAETNLGCFGLSICYDIRFPELYRAMALGGAQIMCVSANFTKPTGIHHWRPLLRARAIENTSYLLAAGQCGIKPGFESYGHSMIIDPWGEILLEMGESPGVGLAEIDLDRVAEVRRQLPCLANVRNDLWHG